MAKSYRNLSFDDAQAEALRLLKESIETGRWFHLPETLMQLRMIMQPVSDKQGRLKLG